MMREADSNGDGKIDYAEFVKVRSIIAWIDMIAETIKTDDVGLTDDDGHKVEPLLRRFASVLWTSLYLLSCYHDIQTFLQSITDIMSLV